MNISTESQLNYQSGLVGLPDNNTEIKITLGWIDIEAFVLISNVFFALTFIFLGLIGNSLCFAIFGFTKLK
jgi:hypothetical protein